MTTDQLKVRVKGALGRLGYDIRRLPTGPSFPSQRSLLSGQKVSVILDVGAYIGDTVANYRKLFPSARAHAFEPLQHAYTHLTQRFSDDPLVSIHGLAVTDRVGSTEFHVSSWETFSSVLAPAASMQINRPDVPVAWESIRVPSVTLDAFCHDQGIEHVDILKIDIQGGEMAAFEGAAELLGSQDIDLIFSEVGFVTLYEGQSYFNDVSGLLAAAGYALYGLFDLGFSAGGFLEHANAIFVSRKVTGAVLASGAGYGARLRWGNCRRTAKRSD